jgi:hypothetical protein
MLGLLAAAAGAEEHRRAAITAEAVSTARAPEASAAAAAEPLVPGAAPSSGGGRTLALALLLPPKQGPPALPIPVTTPPPRMTPEPRPGMETHLPLQPTRVIAGAPPDETSSIAAFSKEPSTTDVPSSVRASSRRVQLDSAPGWAKTPPLSSIRILTVELRLALFSQTPS